MVAYAPLDAATVEPLPFGLVNPKTLVGEDSRWEGGFQQESIICNSAVKNIDICNTTAASDVKEASGSNILDPYKPFAVQAQVVCSTLGSLRVDWERRVLDALEACTSKEVDYEICTGELAQAAITAGDSSYPNLYLNNGDAVDLTPTPGTAVRPKHGLALLEGALANANCGTRGFIHAPTSIASVLPLKQKDGMLQTMIGNYVIAGSGYPGTGPGVTGPTLGNEAWIYATGQVTVRLGDGQVAPDSVAQYVDRSVNKIVLSAERPAAVTWDGCAHY